MKFEEFKSKIEEAYKEKFPKSTINCSIFKCLGSSITISCYIATDKTEVSNGIWDNDLFSIQFIIFLPDNWTETNDLPDMMTLEAMKNSITVKPKDRYLYCDYKKPAFRKTKEATAEKIVVAFEKYVNRLYDTLRTEYNNNNLLQRDMELIKKKEYFI